MSPLFTIYFYGFFFLNVIGSAYVFFPNLSPYDSHNYFTLDFFILLLIQSFSFWIILPFQLHKVKQFKTNYSELSLRKTVKVSYAFLLISFFLVGVYFALNGVPVFYAIDLNLGNNLLVDARANFFAEINNFWIYEVGFYTIPQIVCMILYINMKLTNNLKSKIAFYIVLIYSIILSLSFLHKTPLILLFCCIFIVQLLFFNKISVKVITKFVVGFFILIAFGYGIALSGNEITDTSVVVNSILNRVFGVYPLGLAVATTVVEQNGFLHGAASPNFFGLFSNMVNLSEVIHHYIFGFSGNAPAPAIGYAFANYGYLGAVANPFLVCFLLSFYYKLIRSIKNRIFGIAIFSLISIKTLFVSMTSIFDTILNPRDIVVICLIYIIYRIVK